MNGFEDIMGMETGFLQYAMELLKKDYAKELQILYSQSGQRLLSRHPLHGSDAVLSLLPVLMLSLFPD